MGVLPATFFFFCFLFLFSCRLMIVFLSINVLLLHLASLSEEELVPIPFVDLTVLCCSVGT
jgi:hypothetical protein